MMWLIITWLSGMLTTQWPCVYCHFLCGIHCTGYIWATTDKINRRQSGAVHSQDMSHKVGTCIYWNWNSQEDESESNWSSIIGANCIIAVSRSHDKKLLCKQLWTKLHKSPTISNKLAHILRWRVFWYIGYITNAAAITSFESYLRWP